MFKKILIVLILNTTAQISICNDQEQRSGAPYKPTKTNWLTKISTCPTRARKAGDRCSDVLASCHEFCQNHPEVTPITGAGLLITGFLITPLLTLPFAAGALTGALGYRYYKTPKQD